MNLEGLPDEVVLKFHEFEIKFAFVMGFLLGGLFNIILLKTIGVI
jgi:hypothetical protein